MHLATLDEEVLDDIDEDPEGDEPQAETGGIDLQRPRRVVECLTPLTRETLETGIVSSEPMGQVRGQETNETLGTPPSGSVPVSNLRVLRLGCSSVQFVEEVTEETEWLIPGVLPKGAVVLLSGREGSMKSYLALSMACAVAAGKSWLGRPTKQGSVLYLDGENPVAELSKRVREFGPNHNLIICSAMRGSYPDGLNDADLHHDSRMHSLIVVDTLRRHMGNLKENNADDMAQITKALKELTLCGAAVLVLHHAAKSAENPHYRGSTEIGGGVDITLPLTKKETKAGIRLTLGSIKEGKNRFAATEQLEIEVRKGPHVPSFMMKPETREGAKDTETAGTNPAFLELAEAVEELRRTLKRDPIQKEIYEHPSDKKLGKKKIREMLDQGDGVYWRAVHTGKGKPISYAPAPASPGAGPLTFPFPLYT